MKSTPHGSVPDMRGRKSYRFSCGCCGAFDLREQYAESLAVAEMREESIRVDAAPQPASVAISRAVNRLLMAGMVLRYQSRSGSSYYLGWSGRIGVLRVSDHQSRTHQGDQQHIIARVTLHDGCLPSTEDGFEKLLARALGQFLLRSPAGPIDE